MDLDEFITRRNQAYFEARDLRDAEKILQKLLTDCRHSDPAIWVPIIESDLAVISAKQGNPGLAEKAISSAYRRSVAGNPFTELLVTYNRCVIYDVLGMNEQSIEWAINTSEITRVYEKLLSEKYRNNALDAIFFEIGTASLHAAISYYTDQEEYEINQELLPDAVRWINRAIDDYGPTSAHRNGLVNEKARLLELDGVSHLGLKESSKARESFLQASRLFMEAGDKGKANRAAMLAGSI